MPIGLRHDPTLERARTHAVTQLWVHFRIRDSYHPDPRSLLEQLHGEDLLQGRVVELVKRRGNQPGEAEQVFAAVEVEGIPDLVLIPKDRIVGWVGNGSLR
jgi:hypothetical protein